MRSSRADISAWIVGGTSIAAPGASPIIATICSANSGLPSAASTTFASVSAGTPASASRPTISRTASSPSGVSWMVVAFGWSPQPWRSSSSSARAGQRIITAASIVSARCSIRSSSVGSAQCRSLITSTSG